MVSLSDIVLLFDALNNTLTAYPGGDKHNNDGVSVTFSCRKYKRNFNIQNLPYPGQRDINHQWYVTLVIWYRGKQP
jgi:hypothetical protein